MTKEKLSMLLLRIGLIAVFLYAAIASFIEPDAWIDFLPSVLQPLFPAAGLLVAFSIYELLLSAWLISGKFLFYAALLSALTVAGIIAVNFWIIDIVFRDIAIFFSALALAALAWKPRTQEKIA